MVAVTSFFPCSMETPCRLSCGVTVVLKFVGPDPVIAPGLIGPSQTGENFLVDYMFDVNYPGHLQQKESSYVRSIPLLRRQPRRYL